MAFKPVSVETDETLTRSWITHRVVLVSSSLPLMFLLLAVGNWLNGADHALSVVFFVAAFCAALVRIRFSFFPNTRDEAMSAAFFSLKNLILTVEATALVTVAACVIVALLAQSQGQDTQTANIALWILAFGIHYW